jgi:uncharacterized membrane protein
MPINSLAIFLLIALFFVAMIQIEFFEIAFAKLGLTPETSVMILMGVLLGSGINLPIYIMEAKDTGHMLNLPGQRPAWELFKPAKAGKIVIAINVGGCVIPVSLCLYFLSQQMVEPISLLLALSAITALSYKLSRPVAGLGIAMPIFVAPLVSAGLALLLDPEHAAHLAYISGVLGVLIGADILRLKDIAVLGAPIASIGGAGTFDGIFMTGIIAALLA